MIEIVYILFLSFVTASFSNWFDDCLQPNMIFARWGEFVKDKFWLKPLGGCLICTNTWVNIVTAFGVFIFAGLNAWEFILLSVTLISISNTFLKFIIK